MPPEDLCCRLLRFFCGLLSLHALRSEGFFFVLFLVSLLETLLLDLRGFDFVPIRPSRDPSMTLWWLVFVVFLLVVLVVLVLWALRTRVSVVLLIETDDRLPLLPGRPRRIVV